VKCTDATALDNFRVHELAVVPAVFCGERVVRDAHELGLLFGRTPARNVLDQLIQILDSFPGFVILPNGQLFPVKYSTRCFANSSFIHLIPATARSCCSPLHGSRTKIHQLAEEVF